MDPHARYLRYAIALAAENVRLGRGGPFGCVIVRDGEIIARGTNRVTASNDPTAHAEVVAIREACRTLGTYQLTGCTLYTSCEPCPMCLGAIYWARPDALWFAATKDDAARAGFDDSFIYEQLPLAPEQRRIPAHQSLRDEAQAPFETWLAQAGRIEY